MKRNYSVSNFRRQLHFCFMTLAVRLLLIIYAPYTLRWTSLSVLNVLNSTDITFRQTLFNISYSRLTKKLSKLCRSNRHQECLKQVYRSSCPVLSCLVLSCPVLSCLVLSISTIRQLDVLNSNQIPPLLDLTNDRRSMERKLQESMYLVVKRNRTDFGWQFPQGKLLDSESSMRTVSENSLK